jgi:hypothetical protein
MTIEIPIWLVYILKTIGCGVAVILMLLGVVFILSFIKDFKTWEK